MATKTGVWDLQDVRDKQLQDLWSYEEPAQWWSWGYNGSKGKLGHNDKITRSSPTQIGTATNWVSLSGERHVGGAVNADGELFLVGKGDSNGQLAQGNNTNYSSPVQVPGTTWDGRNFRMGCESQISMLKTDGTLWSWGYACYGRAGTPNTGCVNISSPRQIPGTTWASNFTHSRGGGAIKTDGTLWMWGINAEGNLGQNSRTYRSSPIQIPGTTWKQGCGNGSGIAAVKTDGTLWKWGRGTDGTGLNNTVNYSSPAQIPGTTWKDVGNGNHHFMATKTDGTLWSFGQNSGGQLGQNDVQPGDGGYSSPVQIPGTTWNYVSSGMGNHSLVTKTDGTLWTWGNNSQGQLGQNNRTQYSSPVQIGSGTNWQYAMSLSYASQAIGYQA